MKRYETNRKFSSVPQIKKLGRPKKFATVEDLEEQIQAYFDSCFVKIRKKVITSETDEKKEYEYVDDTDPEGNFIVEQIRPFTVTGLAIYLDTSRETLLDYEKNEENAAFSDTIKKAKMYIHQYAEEYLYEGKNQTAAIFNLKNNWGWVDRIEQDVFDKRKQISPEVLNAKVDDILKEDTPKNEDDK